MFDNQIATLMSDRSQLADKAAALGQENLILREANASVATLRQELQAAQNEATALRAELAILKRSRLLRLTRKVRKVLNLPTWN